MKILMVLIIAFMLLGCGDSAEGKYYKIEQDPCENCKSPKYCDRVGLTDDKHPDIPYDYVNMCIKECEGFYKDGYLYKTDWGTCRFYKYEENK